MAGPWEKYAVTPAEESGPWAKYAAPAAEPAIPTKDDLVQKQSSSMEGVYPYATGEAEIKAASGGFRGWMHDLESDIRYGNDRTFVGKILKKMGAQGVNVGSQAAAGDQMAS